MCLPRVLNLKSGFYVFTKHTIHLWNAIFGKPAIGWLKMVFAASTVRPTSTVGCNVTEKALVHGARLLPPSFRVQTWQVLELSSSWESIVSFPKFDMALPSSKKQLRCDSRSDDSMIFSSCGNYSKNYTDNYAKTKNLILYILPRSGQNFPTAVNI